jgi:manganese-dependent ADP-ribose/CDP-alcohol diphosphatase
MNPEVSFGVMADCQYADAPDHVGSIKEGRDQFVNCYRQSPRKLEDAITTFNKHDLDFIVHLGDFIDRDLEDAHRLHRITGRASAPLWHVLGNHEFWNAGTDVQKVLDLYNMESKYYSKQVGGSRFIMLDTNELGPLQYKPHSREWKIGNELIERMKREGAIQAHMWNGGLGEQQLEWFDRELAEADAANEKTIIFAHHPVFPPGVLNALNRNEILQTIDSHDNVVAFINGHNHGGAFGVRRDVPYVTLPGMLSGPTNAYGVASLYRDRLEIKGYGRVLDTVLEIGR